MQYRLKVKCVLGKGQGSCEKSGNTGMHYKSGLPAGLEIQKRPMWLIDHDLHHVARSAMFSNFEFFVPFCIAPSTPNPPGTY